MKTLILIALSFFVSLTTSAQYFHENVVKGKLYLSLQMLPEQKEYKDINVLMSRKEAKRFLKKLERHISTVERWTRKAVDHHVSTYRKPIHGTIKFHHLEFYFDRSYSTSQGYFMVPAFDVDDEGNCYLLLRGYYKGRNVTPYLVSFREGDKIRYRQLSEFNYYVRIPSKDLRSWQKRAINAFTKYENDLKDFKRRKNYFK